MNAAQQRRMVAAVQHKIDEMASTPTAVARAARIDPKTLRRLLDGHLPNNDAQTRIEAVLRWPVGGLITRAAREGSDGVLDGYSDAELSAEVTRRLVERERREARLRESDRRHRRQRRRDQ